MKFDKARVYTALNADELKVGSKVICGNTLMELKKNVHYAEDIKHLKRINDEFKEYRFYCGADSYSLAYLIEVPDNIESYEQWEAIYNENRPIEPYSIDSEGAAVLYEAIADYAERNLKNAFIAGQQVERLKKITEE